MNDSLGATNFQPAISEKLVDEKSKDHRNHYEVAEYVRSMTGSLMPLCNNSDLELLKYLLGMVFEEADSICQNTTYPK